MKTHGGTTVTTKVNNKISQKIDTRRLESGVSGLGGGDLADLFESELSDKVIGQPEAVKALVRAYRTFIVGLNPPNRPVAVLLFAGSTGVGKSNCAHAAALALLGNRQGLTRIDCAEFQHSHEIAKLIGSPPGYLGHRETEPTLAQARIDKFQVPAVPLNIVLFDEIEKANGALWSLLLGIMDNGTLALGTGQVTDFSHSIVLMTTNLGAKEMDRILKGGYIGFAQPEINSATAVADLAIRGNFSPEFINRVDAVITFNQLSKEDLYTIFKLEMEAVQKRILDSKCPIFILRWTPKAAEYLITKGTDARYGARELKRVLERVVVQPLTDIVLARKVDVADTITVDLENDEIIFTHTPR